MWSNNLGSGSGEDRPARPRHVGEGGVSGRHFPPMQLIDEVDHQSYQWAIAEHPTVYLAALLLSIAATLIYVLRFDGIFACPADGYREDSYLAYCHADRFGDYDHGAFWFGLEPEASRFASEAKVLFLGSSRLQFAFSTDATARFFDGIPYYLLGFSHTENSVFAEPLLAELRPHAQVYVLNVDRFFDVTPTPPADQIMHQADSRERYRAKQAFQTVHSAVCTHLPFICDSKLAYFRDRRDGTWRFSGVPLRPPETIEQPFPSIEDGWNRYVPPADAFLAALPVERSCVLLTIVPYPGAKLAEAKAIANAVGLDLIVPNVSDLRTYDGSHLDASSAERWSQAFYEAAGPRIKACLDLGHSRIAKGARAR